MIKKIPDEIHEIVWMIGSICLMIGVLMVVGKIDSSKVLGIALVGCGFGWIIYKIQKFILDYKKRNHVKG